MLYFASTTNSKSKFFNNGVSKSTNTLELDTRLDKAALRVKYSMLVKVLPGHFSIIHEILRACPFKPRSNHG